VELLLEEVVRGQVTLVEELESFEGKENMVVESRKTWHWEQWVVEQYLQESLVNFESECGK